MGKAVVYCSACGKSFREDVASSADPVCPACRPAETAPRPTPRSSAAIPALASTPRRARPAVQPSPSRAPLWIGAGLALATLLVLGIALSSPRRPAEPPPAPGPAPRPAPTARSVPVPAPAPARSDPGAVEREMRATQEREQAGRFDSYLGQIRQLIRGGAAASRGSEIEAMLESARREAGSRRAEVDALAAEFATRRAEPPAEARLRPDDARLRGERIALKERDGIRYLGNWNRTTDEAEWTARAPRAGRYRVHLEYAASTAGGGRLAAEFGGEKLEADLAPTGDWRTYRTVELGAVTLPAGEFRVLFRGSRVSGDGLMNFRSLLLAAE